ncbi:flagellar hook assembly protein FlgD [Azospirillum melinis]|uniref:Basal-body rod modification protein FlgD n=1 Tax=Azospirillum melinis TaxID=328839 RepID=A0ABX2KK95_9PROT|nr:flagellar hook assembly protein FlgD [Azospirillum melinis]MBP2310432.1 flagellar basal-body rod modification protein FlgD [Azospirillum melinis]NUB02982.1 flagellar hook assembly protein FlgD [Azospirillum melinis]
MTTTPSTGPTTTATKTGATKTAATEEPKKATVDYESFLKLLTAQLRNQDPLAPMDATQFMTQLAQLSTVEQSMRSNDTLGKVLDTLKSSGMRMDMALLGRKVEVASDQLSLSGGKAEAAYTVDGTPASVKLEVLNSSGSVVYSTPGSLKTGRQVFDWTGKTASGGTAPDGVYTLRVTAKDKDGKALNSATVVTDTVAEVRSVDGASKFVLKNGATVDSSAVLSAS